MLKYCIVSRGCEKSCEIKEVLKNNIKLEYNDINPNYVIVVGGDGTILRGIHEYSHLINDVVFFGIHTGNLGFLTNYKVDDVNLIIDILNKGLDFEVEEHNILDFKLESDQGLLHSIALNEVSITAAPEMISLDVCVNKEHLEYFNGGGLCISTPLGSTGYNKSLHGAVIDHRIPCYQVTEIAGINSNSYKTLTSPLLLRGSRVLKVKSLNNNKALFTYDNNSLVVDSFLNLEVTISEDFAKFAYSNDINFVKRVNKAFL